MNCNLVIENDHGDLLDDIKELSTISRLLLEKLPAYQFDLSLLRLAFYFPGTKHEVDELYFFYMKRRLIFIAGNMNFMTSKIIK